MGVGGGHIDTTIAATDCTPDVKRKSAKFANEKTNAWFTAVGKKNAKTPQKIIVVNTNASLKKQH